MLERGDTKDKHLLGRIIGVKLYAYYKRLKMPTKQLFVKDKREVKLYEQ